MEIRKIQMEDANNYLDMLLNLDNIKELNILTTLMLEYVRNTEVRELEVNYFLN